MAPTEDTVVEMESVGHLIECSGKTATERLSKSHWIERLGLPVISARKPPLE